MIFGRKAIAIVLMATMVQQTTATDVSGFSFLVSGSMGRLLTRNEKLETRNESYGAEALSAPSVSESYSPFSRRELGKLTWNGLLAGFAEQSGIASFALPYGQDKTAATPSAPQTPAPAGLPVPAAAAYFTEHHSPKEMLDYLFNLVGGVEGVKRLSENLSLKGVTLNLTEAIEKLNIQSGTPAEFNIAKACLLMFLLVTTFDVSGGFHSYEAYVKRITMELTDTHSEFTLGLKLMHSTTNERKKIENDVYHRMARDLATDLDSYRILTGQKDHNIFHFTADALFSSCLRACRLTKAEPLPGADELTPLWTSDDVFLTVVRDHIKFVVSILQVAPFEVGLFERESRFYVGEIADDLADLQKKELNKRETQILQAHIGMTWKIKAGLITTGHMDEYLASNRNLRTYTNAAEVLIRYWCFEFVKTHPQLLASSA
jgi:hypothetical protein